MAQRFLSSEPFPEILSLIFKDLPDAACASLVCRQWHGAAVTDSELWLSIMISDPISTVQKFWVVS